MYLMDMAKLPLPVVITFLLIQSSMVARQKIEEILGQLGDLLWNEL